MTFLCPFYSYRRPVWFHPADCLIPVSVLGYLGEKPVQTHWIIILSVTECSCQMVCAVRRSTLCLAADKPLISTQISFCFQTFSIYFHVPEILPAIPALVQGAQWLQTGTEKTELLQEYLSLFRQEMVKQIKKHKDYRRRKKGQGLSMTHRGKNL